MQFREEEVQERIERLRELNQYLEEAIEELTELLVLLVGMKKKVDRKIREGRLMNLNREPGNSELRMKSSERGLRGCEE